MILEIFKYLRTFPRIHVKTCPHTLINWITCKIDLTSKERDGKLLLLPWTGDPLDPVYGRSCEFARTISRIVAIYARRSSETIYTVDVVKTHKSAGKLWITLRDGRCVDEESNRVYELRCRTCRSVPGDAKQVCLLRRQSGLCLRCFTKLLPEDVRERYWHCTCNTSIGSRGYRIDYDPLLALVKSVFHESDESDRQMFRQPHPISETTDDRSEGQSVPEL